MIVGPPKRAIKKVGIDAHTSYFIGHVKPKGYIPLKKTGNAVLTLILFVSRMKTVNS
jgi:hypothetical protein